jgi:hypothetical protein
VEVAVDVDQAIGGGPNQSPVIHSPCADVRSVFYGHKFPL